MQPSYLPWSGYFNLIAESNVFVFLDDAQLQKNSWHNRNRILVNHSPHWITVPVSRKSLSQTINETTIDSRQNWKQKHIKLLGQTYSKHPFSEDVRQICEVLEAHNFNTLAELNIYLIKFIMSKIGIETKVLLSSELNIIGKRTDRIVSIVESLNADVYLSAQGSAEYLDLDGFIEQTSVNLAFQTFEPKVYNHFRHDEFESHLSIVDVIANLGWDKTKEYIL
jgi:hypothetical protein